MKFWWINHYNNSIHSHYHKNNNNFYVYLISFKTGYSTQIFNKELMKNVSIEGKWIIE